MQKRRSILFKLSMALLAAVVLMLAWIGHGIVHMLDGLPDAYAGWDTAELVIDHLRTTGGQWPRGWDDLKPSYDRLSHPVDMDHRLHGNQSFEELQRRISIDWTADPATLARAPDDRQTAPFHVIRPTSGNQTTWSGAEPNQMILDYLRETSHTTTRATPPATAP